MTAHLPTVYGVKYIRTNMKDKFTEYYSTPEKIAELSEYVHLNFRVIMTKMQSEMRRKLDIEPNMENRDGYYSLMLSLQGRLFNEMVYSLVSVLQSMNNGGTKVFGGMRALPFQRNYSGYAL